MQSFKAWHERKEKLIAMRKWLWSKELGKDAPQPVPKGDPDYDWVTTKMKELGSLDPYAQVR